MSQHYHAVVWIDHHEARVFHFNTDAVDHEVVHPTHRVHHKGKSIGGGHPAADHEFLQAVVGAIGSAGAVLIGGPANAKHELYKHIQGHAPQLLPHITAVETLDHPTDRELVAHARRFFRAADRMAPQRT
ncbi:MAG TPA: hypothetical protein VGF89_13220 [Steroidobacteraceae bacterium]